MSEIKGAVCVIKGCGGIAHGFITVGLAEPTDLPVCVDHFWKFTRSRTTEPLLIDDERAALRLSGELDGTAVSTQYSDLDGVRWRIVTRWRQHRGRLEPFDVAVASPDLAKPVVGHVIRRLPLGTLQKEVRDEAKKYQVAAGLGDIATAPGIGSFGTHRGIAVTQEELKVVADVYRTAYPGGGVTKAVADAIGVSSSTAAKRIMMARKAGLLDGLGVTR